MAKKENKILKPVKNNNRKSIFIIALIGILLDQISKFWIRYQFNNVSQLITQTGTFLGFNVIPGKGIELIKDFFYIIDVKNTGGAWGIFSGNVLVLAIISTFVLVMLYFFLKEEKKITKLGIAYYGMLFSGIIGNLIDRLFNGYVTDFLNFYILGYDYPVFNIADILIVLGIILMIIDVVRGEIHEFNKRKGKC